MGQFFPLPAARLMLKELERGRGALALQPKLERRVELGKHRVVLLGLDVASWKQQSVVWKDTAQQQAKARVESRAWYRSPQLWFAVGVIAGAAAAVGLAAGVVRVVR